MHRRDQHEHICNNACKCAGGVERNQIDPTWVAPDNPLVAELVLWGVLRNVSRERGAVLLVELTVGRAASSATRNAITVVAIPYLIREMINHNRKN